MTKEDQLQIQVIRYLQIQYKEKIFFHVPNGGSRNVIEASKLKKMGVLAGVCDVLVLNPMGSYNGLAIELKIKPNRVNENQINFINKLEKINWYTKVCYDFETAKNVIDVYFSLGKQLKQI
jgi:hypothetical protein